MRKKFFAMYALVGALVASPVFTSCVDDTESASVTAIRNANAEKIKAATAMEQAMHEIEKAKAEADLAFRKLEIEEKEISNEEAKAKLEERKAYYENQMLLLQKQIIVNAEALKEYQDATLARLASSYQTALNSVASFNINILQQQGYITQLKAGITTVQAYVANRTAYYNARIAETEAAIKALKEAQAENLDAEELEAKIAELEEVSNEALNAVKEWAIKYGVAVTSSTDFSTITVANAKNLATIKAYNELTSVSGLIETNADGFYYLKEAVVATEKESLADGIKQAEKILADKIASIGKDTDKKDTEYTYISIDGTTGVETEHSALTLYAQLAAAKADILGAPKAGDTPASGAYIILEKLEAKVAEIKADLALETPTTYDEDDLDDAEADLLAYKTDKSAATDATAVDYDDNGTNDAGFAWAEDQVAAAENAILSAKDLLVGLEDAVAGAKKDSEEFEAYIATFAGEDYEAYKEAAAALKEVQEAYKTAYAEYDALNNTYDPSVSSVDYTYSIYQKERELADYKQDLAQITVWIYSNNSEISLPAGPTGVDPATEEEIEVVIAWIEEKIEVMKTQLAIAEEQAAKIKAELDAYLSTDEEGGEVEA